LHAGASPIYNIKSDESNRIQGETSKIQNQQFYRSTVDAMKAREASHAKTQEKVQNAMHSPGENPAAVAGAGAGTVEAAGAAAQKAVVPPAANANDDTEEIPIAGRTKMTVPKKGQDTGVQQEALAEKTEEEKEREEKEKKEAEAKSELNDILKRAPGTFPSTT
jgi:hypothetical protein